MATSTRKSRRDKRARGSENTPRFAGPPPPHKTRGSWVLWVAAAGLLAATLVAYQPAWHGGMLWDDDKHVTQPELRPVAGLARIWFELGATQQYYPVVHSAFWLQHRLWGDATLGYHIVNILLHVCSAWLLFAILRRLQVPGAVLAATVFALHPVQVESVAWITELKNTLSGVFYLAAAWVYLQFDRDRTSRSYVASLALFALALLSKSVTATLPGVLLAVAWWRRGQVQWQRDVRPLLPFFVLGAGAGLFTAWVEWAYIGAKYADFHFTLVERGLIAGRVVWFYLGKLAWPSNLMFMYPRWHVSQTEVLQYAYPLAVAALIGALWLLRTRSRAPLAALLAFGGSLFPVLGFFNVYPFTFSFVADHFQYLATIPAIVLASAGVATLGRRWLRQPEPFMWAVTLVCAILLGSLTHAQSRQYSDADTLYRATLERNPSCWLAHANLGATLYKSNPAEALVHLNEALRLKPDSADAEYNLGNALQQLDRLAEAADAYRATIRLEPRQALAHYNLARVLHRMDRLDEARAAYEETIRIAPGLALAHSGFGRLLQQLGQADAALGEAEAAVRLEPDLAVAHYDLATVLQAQGRLEQAASEYEVALRLHPDDAEVHNDLAYALQQLGRFSEANAHYEEAIRLSPGEALIRCGRCGVLRVLGRFDEALRDCEIAVQLQPRLAIANYELGNARLQQGRFPEAVAAYQAALQIEPNAAEIHYNLSTALERSGQGAQAREHLREALRLVPNQAAAAIMSAEALEAQGQLEGARQAYEQALRLTPDLPGGRQNLLRVDAALRLTGRDPAKHLAAGGR